MKKSGIETATRKIAGTSGKGPYMAREIMQGSKCMSSKSGALKSAQGKMSSAQGTNGQSKNNNMDKNTGGYKIGSGCRTFKKEGYNLAGPVSGSPRHATQPKGHKSQ